jgi:hypothetical protein
MTCGFPPSRERQNLNKYLKYYKFNSTLGNKYAG